MGKCHICGLEPKNLGLHMKTEHTGTLYTCEVCSKSFRSLFCLETHKLAHHTTHECQYCPRTFTSFTKFKRHVLLHSEVKEFMCEVCSKQFADNIRLQSHIKRQHVFTKTHTCAKCGAAFTTPHKLKRHSATHLAVKPYSCQFCGKQCTQSTNLKVHIMGVHKDKSHLVYGSTPTPKLLEFSSVVIPSHKEYQETIRNKCNIIQPRKPKIKKPKKKVVEINFDDDYSRCSSDETADEKCPANNISEIKHEPELLDDHEIKSAEIQFVKIPPEWNEVRQPKVILNNCGIEIPIKVEKDDTNIFIKEEDDSWDDTKYDCTETETCNDVKPPDGSLKPVRRETLDRICKNLDEKICVTESRTKSRIRLCKKCNESFPNAAELKKHKAKFHIQPIVTPRPIFCVFCRKNFENKLDHKKHISEFHADGIYTCQHCPKKTKSKTGMRNHVLSTHTECKQFKCKYCPSSFACFTKWKRHTLVSHTNHQGRYLCHICSKSFKLNSSLISHVKFVHMKIRKYKCETCGKSFTQSNKLERHVRVHSKDKPYKCQFCGKECTQKGNLKIHIMGVHRDVSDQVYKKTKVTELLDVNSVILPATSKEYLKIFSSAPNETDSKETIVQESQT